MTVFAADYGRLFPGPLVDEATPFDDVQALLAEAELGDGLPLVPPTERRLQAMLAHVADPARSYGRMPPLFGDLTAAGVAYQAVLAGCRPAELPIVLTAAQACLAPAFNLLGLLTTTGTPAVATVVHGPVARALGMNDGVNCLGPGNRANAAIGRAMSLALRNIGGARENVGDMATMGQPGKYGFCFAEAASDLIPSLATRRGLPAGASAVTVVGVSGTMEALPLDDRDAAERVLLPIAAAMMAAGAVAGAGRSRAPGEQVVLLPPEMVAAIAKSGWDLARVRDYLFDVDRVALPGVGTFSRSGPIASSAGDILPIVTGGPGIKMTYLPIWAGGSRTQTVPLLDLVRP